MNFTSVSFLFYFLPIVLLIYFCLGKVSFKNAFLLMASLIFYAWGEGFFLILLLLSIAMNHFLSQLLDRSPHKKLWLALGLGANLLILIFFKYTGFILQHFGLEESHRAANLHLPLGISFFTFQSMSLLFDVYRGQSPMQKITHTGLYISMFPQLIAGPIVRFNDIKSQILNRSETVDQIAAGIRIFILGLAQKVLLADILAIPADTAFTASPDQLTVAAAWLGVICFSFQIYFDFAGYSNMAIGIGRMFGFELPQNFNYPYSARSFKEFWRRWHITLSRWFRDYLYIPLGGSRGGNFATYRNLFIVFILCGLWHGAAWTFILWGLWHGSFLVLERVFPSKLTDILKTTVIGNIYTLIGVLFGWVLFRSNSLETALGYWKAMLGQNNATTVFAQNLNIGPLEWCVLCVSILISWDGWERKWQSGDNTSLFGQLSRWSVCGALLILSFIFVGANTHQAFIYFRF